jgi:hypothetical protein
LRRQTAIAELESPAAVNCAGMSASILWPPAINPDDAEVLAELRDMPR